MNLDIVWPVLNHNVCILVGFFVGFIAIAIIFYYLEMILRRLERLDPPLNFNFSEIDLNYCPRCGHEMCPAYEAGEYDDSGDWLLDYCPVCIEAWR
jgi:hypothetical protein